MRSGQCRICSCVEAAACPSGCAWVDRAQTLCSACAKLGAWSRPQVLKALCDAKYLKASDVRKRWLVQEAIEELVDRLGEIEKSTVEYIDKQLKTAKARVSGAERKRMIDETFRFALTLQGVAAPRALSVALR